MVKKEFVELLAEKTGLKKSEAEKALNSTLEIISKELVKGNEVIFTGFGKFSTKDREARIGRNPSNGEEIQIPACRVPVFKAGKQLKDLIK